MSSDVLLLASAGEDLRLWSVPELELWSVKNDNDGVTCCDCSPSGQLFAYTKEGGGIVVASLNDDAILPIDINTTCQQSCVQFNESSKYVVSGGADSVVTIWDVKTGSSKRTFKEHVDPVTCCTFSNKDIVVASGSSKGDIILANVQTGSSDVLNVPEKEAIRSVKYSLFSKALLASVSETGSLYLWDTKDNTMLKQFTEHKAPATGLSFSPVNEMLLCSTGLDKKILFYDVVGKKCVKTIACDSPATCCEFLHDGATVGVGTASGKIFLYDLRKGSSPVKVIGGHQTSVKSLSFQKIPKRLKASASTSSLESKLQQTPAMQIPNAVTKPVPDTAKTVVPSSPTTATVAPTINYPTVANGEKNGTKTGDNLVNRTELSRVHTSLAQSILAGSAVVNDEVFSPIPTETSLQAYKNPLQRYNSAPKKTLSRPTSVAGSPSEVRKSENWRPVYPRSKSGLSKVSLNKATLDEAAATPKRNKESDETDGKIKSGLLNFMSPFSKKDKKGKHSDNESDTCSIDSMSLDDGKSFGFRRKLGRTSSRSNDSAQSRSRKNSVDRDLHSRKLSTDSNNGGRVSPFGIGRSIDTNQLLDDIQKSLQASEPPSPRLMNGSANYGNHNPGTTPPVVGMPSQFQAEFVKRMIEDSFEDLRDELQENFVSLHVEIIRQMEIQKEQIRQMLQHFSINDELVNEIERLKEENLRLKTKY